MSSVEWMFLFRLSWAMAASLFVGPVVLCMYEYVVPITDPVTRMAMEFRCPRMRIQALAWDRSKSEWIKIIGLGSVVEIARLAIAAVSDLELLKAEFWPSWLTIGGLMMLIIVIYVVNRHKARREVKEAHRKQRVIWELMQRTQQMKGNVSSELWREEFNEVASFVTRRLQEERFSLEEVTLFGHEMMRGNTMSNRPIMLGLNSILEEEIMPVITQHHRIHRRDVQGPSAG